MNIATAEATPSTRATTKEEVSPLKTKRSTGERGHPGPNQEATREIEGATKAGPGRGESAEAITAATPEREGSALATEEAATAMTPKESTPAKRTTTATTAATARESPIRKESRAVRSTRAETPAIK